MEIPNYHLPSKILCVVVGVQLKVLSSFYKFIVFTNLKCLMHVVNNILIWYCR